MAGPDPVAVATTGLKAMALGASHACGITSANGLVCWGSNGHGQLGDTTTVDSAAARSVNVGTVAQVVAGAGHTCARKMDASLVCWGDAVKCWGITALLGNGDLMSARPDATSLVCPAGT